MSTKKKPAKKPAAKKPAAKKPALKITSTSSTLLAVGSPAPSFSLLGDDGQQHTLSSYRGKNVVLYFYPRDNTPGCTTEACDFRDNMERIAATGTVVLGVSRDTTTSHGKFRAKFSLNFPLLVDTDLVAHTAYGCWGTKMMYGKAVMGTIRSTFLIDGQGLLKQAWTGVRVPGHVDNVLLALKS